MKRPVQNLIRWIAAGMIIFGGFEIGLELLRHRMNSTEIRMWHCIVGSGLIVVGGVLFAVSGWLAGQLTDDDDGDNTPDLKLPPSDDDL